MRSHRLLPALALVGLLLPVALVSSPAQSADRVVKPPASTCSPGAHSAVATWQPAGVVSKVAVAV